MYKFSNINDPPNIKIIKPGIFTSAISYGKSPKKIMKVSMKGCGKSDVSALAIFPKEPARTPIINMTAKGIPLLITALVIIIMMRVFLKTRVYSINLIH